MSALTRLAHPELMDDPSLASSEHEHALRGLARLNRWSRSAAALLDVLELARCAADAPGELRLLDVGSGGGDVPVALALEARRRGWRVRMGLCDISARALELSRDRAARAGIDAEGYCLDAARDELPEGFDVATCSLLLHHLSAEGVTAVLAGMARAVRMVAVSDLRRCRAGTALAWTASRALCRSRIVRYDAVVSAKAAWTMGELLELAERAGLHGARVRASWPCRMTLSWRRA